MIDKVKLMAWCRVRDSFLECLNTPVDNNYIGNLVLSFYKLCGVLDYMRAIDILIEDDYLSQLDFYQTLYINRRFSFI